MSRCKPIATPMVSKLRPSTTEDEPFSDPNFYRSIVGGFQYLTFTRSNIAFSVNYVYQYMNQPTNFHFKLVKHIVKYIQGTLPQGICLLANNPLVIYGFLSADWAGCPITRRSTVGYCTYLGGNYISWSAKKQPTVVRSSIEVEYRAMASTTTELTWIMFLLRDIGLYLDQPPTLFCDNNSALLLTINLVFHSRTKHIDLDYHFVREKVALGSLVTRFISSTNQVAYIFTKPLP